MFFALPFFLLHPLHNMRDTLHRVLHGLSTKSISPLANRCMVLVRARVTRTPDNVVSLSCPNWDTVPRGVGTHQRGQSQLVPTKIGTFPRTSN